MGAIARGKLPHLIEDLLHNPSAYSAFQAWHLVETNLGEEGAMEGDLRSFLEMAPASEMTFPAGEIRHCRVDDRSRYRLELNFMGFYGVDSPLPQFFNDIATYDTPRGEALRKFLELFNKRLYHLLYQAWKKMNVHGSGGGRTSLYRRYLEALQGGNCRHAGRFDYAGIQLSRVKNAQSMSDMLEDFLSCPVKVRKNIPCWIDLEDSTCLGGGFKLGENAMLGSRIMDVNSKVLIRIGPLSIHEAAHLLPGGTTTATLAQMIRGYLDPTLQYDVEMLIRPDAEFESALGSDRSVLGWTACLGKAGDAINRVLLTGESLDRQGKTSKS